MLKQKRQQTKEKQKKKAKSKKQNKKVTHNRLVTFFVYLLPIAVHIGVPGF